MRAAILVALTLWAPLHAALAQRVVVEARIREASGAPVPYVSVIVAKGGRVVSNDSGTAVMRLAPGQARLELRRVGFQPVSVALNVARDTSIEVVMSHLPRELEATHVTATAHDVLARRGFYDRLRDADRGLVYGYFVTPEEIDARRPFRTSQLLERVPGVKMLGTGGNNVTPVGMNDCRMTLYVDGGRVTLAGDDSRARGSTGMSMQRLMGSGAGGGRVTPGGTLDDIVSVGSVTGIEIYPRGTRAPGMFQLLNGTCGIIAIWTR